MATFAVCPTSVQEASWEAWESRRMRVEDHSAQPPPPPPADEEEPLSDLSAADSPRERRQKLRSLAATGPNEAQVAHLRAVRRNAKRNLANIRAGRHSRPELQLRLQNLAADIDAGLSGIDCRQRNADGTFRWTTLEQGTKTP